MALRLDLVAMLLLIGGCASPRSAAIRLDTPSGLERVWIEALGLE